VIGGIAFIGASSADSLLDQLSQSFPKIRTFVFGATGVMNVCADIPGIGAGVCELKQGDILQELAPLQSQTMLGESMVNLFNHLADIATKAFQARTQETQPLFRVDVAADYAAVSQGMDQYLG